MIDNFNHSIRLQTVTVSVPYTVIKFECFDKPKRNNTDVIRQNGNICKTVSIIA